ncbi:hypothetical protein USDA257_c16740 [Sinorhizobium fredii USDA 257]|uniref:Uncharacterized protein n=1 Tax=Sinorhizobium fredii (strain USDA 257) TaxID=1185652 RepID=I3X306_SINF2|nr:hypothetical protein USDA257_c16740 [Sinorhizobium fredii USDA 257]
MEDDEWVTNTDRLSIKLRVEVLQDISARQRGRLSGTAASCAMMTPGEM